MRARFDILKNKSFPLGKKWVYKIEILDEEFLEEFELDTRKTTLFIQNEVVDTDETGTIFIEVEFSEMEFDSLPEKISSFFNKVANLTKKYTLELNKEGQIVNIHFKEDNFTKDQIAILHKDAFYNNLSQDEKLTLNESINEIDKSYYKKEIKNSLILLFCYPGYFRDGLTNEFSLETHHASMKSNFLKDVKWDVLFNMSIYNINANKEIELLCTGDVEVVNEAEESLLYQKIHDYFDLDGNDTYTDYTFVVMGDYLLSGDDFIIKKASVNICETLNNQEIEFNKNIQISLLQ